MIKMRGEARKRVEFCDGKDKEAAQDGLSLVAQFDQLVRNRRVLTASDGEEKFLAFVKGADTTRQRWEATEAQCEKLADQLVKSNQEVSMLEGRLDQARGMLQTEVESQPFPSIGSLVLPAPSNTDLSVILQIGVVTVVLGVQVFLVNIEHLVRQRYCVDKSYRVENFTMLGLLTCSVTALNSVISINFKI